MSSSESAATLAGQKRPHEGDANGDRDATAKRPRRDESDAIVVHAAAAAGSGTAITAYQPPIDPLAEKGGRTSSLSSPNYLLSGHQAAVLGARFSPSGRILATCSRDRSVLLWRIEDGADPENYCQLTGHKNAVLDVAWGRTPSNDDEAQQIYTASADGTGGVWDVESGNRIRKFAGHVKTVNSISSNPHARSGPSMVATGSDDATVKLWDARSKNAVHSFSDAYPVTAVALAEDASSIFAAGIEGVVKQWDVRKGSVTMRLTGHRDMVTGLSLSPDGNTLLSFGVDNALRAWDVRPFFTSPTAASSSASGTFVVPAAAPHLGPGVSERCVKLFVGASNNFEQHLIRPSWSADGTRVVCGSADRSTYCWEFETAKLLYALPGHQGVVTGVAYHPTQPIIASCGTDKKVWLGELVL